MNDDLRIVEEILKNIKIPEARDSMLAAAKRNHMEDVIKILRKILEDEKDTDTIIKKFKEEYENIFLRAIKKRE